MTDFRANPFDHNAECLYCDEQASHAADCPWLLQLVAYTHELVGKIHFLVDWADGRGLLEEHVFTFPDGDTWEARPPKAPR